MPLFIKTCTICFFSIVYSYQFKFFLFSNDQKFNYFNTFTISEYIKIFKYKFKNKLESHSQLTY
jgi:hypothetical protein